VIDAKSTRRSALQGCDEMAYYNQGISGGNGAQGFDDSTNFPDPDPQVRRFSMVRVRSADSICSIQFVYLNASGYEMPARHHGGQGGKEDEFDIGDGEHLIALEGSFGNYVDFIRLITDKGRKKEFGKYNVLHLAGSASVGGPSESPFPGQTNYFGYHRRKPGASATRPEQHFSSGWHNNERATRRRGWCKVPVLHSPLDAHHGEWG